MPNPLLAPLLRWVGRLSYPRLFLVTAVLFVVDVIVPTSFPRRRTAARPGHAAAGELEEARRPRPSPALIRCDWSTVIATWTPPNSMVIVPRSCSVPATPACTGKSSRQSMPRVGQN
jgi:hypothetical protein